MTKIFCVHLLTNDIFDKYFDFYLCSLSESYFLFIYFIYLFYFLEECIAFEVKFAFFYLSYIIFEIFYLFQKYIFCLLTARYLVGAKYAQRNNYVAICVINII